MTYPALPDPRLRRDGTGDVFAIGRVPGHSLLTHGEPYLAVDCYVGRCSTNLRATTHQENTPGVDSVRGRGHAVCGCGELSGHLDTGKARRGWHRAHKARVILGQPEPAGQPAPIAPTAVA